jgi:hypothetical protein
MVAGKGTSKVVPISKMKLKGHTPIVLNNIFVDGVLQKCGPYCPIRYEAPPVIKRMRTMIEPPKDRAVPYHRYVDGTTRKPKGRRL